MKTNFYFLAVVAAFVFMGNKASAQYGREWNAPYPQQENNYRDNRQQSFYYYPQSNVYFSFGTQQYIYPVDGNWITSYRLPRYIFLDNQPRFVVNHFGFDVWNENRFHVERFRNYGYDRRPDFGYDHDRRFERRDEQFEHHNDRFEHRDDRFEHHDRDNDNRRW